MRAQVLSTSYSLTMWSIRSLISATVLCYHNSWLPYSALFHTTSVKNAPSGSLCPCSNAQRGTRFTLTMSATSYISRSSLSDYVYPDISQQPFKATTTTTTFNNKLIHTSSTFNMIRFASVASKVPAGTPIVLTSIFVDGNISGSIVKIEKIDVRTRTYTLRSAL